MKKCMSVFTAMLLSLCIVIAPVTTVTAVEDNTTPVNNDENSVASTENNLSVTGTNGFGNLLSEEFADKQAEQQENMGNNIFSVEVKNNVAKVDFETTENGTLVVGIYDEDGIQMITSASIAVTPEQKNTSVELDSEKMPDYFYIKAFLADSNTLRPMCTSYESPNYTQEMQEFFAKTTDDFEQEKVLNLDEDKSNNFAVYSDDTKIITESTEHNQVLSVDDENKMYVIGSIDSSVSSLKTGDVFAQNYGENNILIVKVATISVNGTTATITGQETDMEEVFDYIKIDTVSDIGEADVNTDGMDDDMTFEGMSEEKTTSSSAKSTSTSASANNSTEVSGDTKFLKYEFEKKFDISTNDPLDNGNIEPVSAGGKVKGSVELSMKFNFKLYLTKSEQYIEIKFDYKFVSELSANVKADFRLPIGKLSFSPIVGVYIKLQPCLVLKISGEINVKITVSGSIGAQLSVQNGAKDISKSPSIEIYGEAKVTIFAGLSLEPSLSIFHENVSKASMEAQVGAELKADLKTGVTFAEERHPCIACVSGEANGKIILKANITFLKKHVVELKPIDITIPIGKFYYSVDYNEFGWGKCPHKEYRCTVTVADANGDVVQGAVINDKYQTNEDGKVNIYFKPEKVTLTAKKDNATGTYTGEIDSPKSIIIKLGSSQTDTSGSGSSSGDNSSSGGSSWSDTGNGYWIGNDEINNTEWKSVSVSGSHVGAVTKNGTLYMWGTNGSGQLGDGTTTNKNVPIRIMDNIRYISLGREHSAAISNSDTLYMWGLNSSGQLGNDTTTNSNIPIKIMDNVKNVYAVNNSTFVITNDGILYSFGNNAGGILGDGTTANRSTPVSILRNVYSICESKNNSSMGVILNNGDLYTWGSNGYGQLGIGLSVSRYSPTKVLNNVKYAEIGDHSAAITKSGELFTWGRNNCKQLGFSDFSNRLTPTKLRDGIKAVSLSKECCNGAYTSAYITQDGELFTFGTLYGAGLGNGRSASSYVAPIDKPEMILSNMKSVVMIAKPNYGLSGYAIDNNGKMYVWGYNVYGELGTGTCTTPQMIFTNVDRIIPNSILTAVVTYDNGVVFSGLYMFGYGSDGEIGNGMNNASNNTPYKITIKSTSTSATVKATTKLTKTYTDLEPDETYNFYVLKDTKAENLLSTDNVYYIAQGTADSDGKLTVTYAPTENYETAHRFVVAMHRTDLSYATVMADTMTYNAEEQYIKPSVKLDGVYLVEGVDYELTGEYSATEPGEYTATINGIGKYTGKVDFTYTMIPDFVNLSTLDKTQLYLGDTITITASAAGGEGAYTYSYYFRNTEELYWIPLETDTAETVIEFEPEEIGTYYARVDVTDETGKISRKAITFTVDSKNLANNSTVSATTIKIGNTLNLYGKAVGGVQPYKYAYYMKDIFSDTWKCLKTYSDTEQYNVKFSQTGTYDVCIKVKDLNNTIAKRYFVIEVKPNKLLPEEIEKGTKTEAVAATCTTDGNIEYYLTDGKYYQFKNGSYTEISLNETVIPKTGHNYVYDDNLASTREGHVMVCTHCGDTVIQEHSYNENDICTVCGYENENIELIDWSKAAFEFTDDSNGLYAYTKRIIAPEFTITYDGKDLEEYADYDFTDDSETESKRAGKHTITIFDKNDETNTFSFDYYIYNLGISATETENTDNKIKFTATRNTDKTNVTKFGMVFDRNGTFADNLSLENRTNISTTTNKSTAKYNVNVADSGKGVYARPYMQVTLNGENYIAYGEVQFFTRYTPEQIAVPTIQDIEPQLVNGKVSVKVQKPVYDTEVYTCKEMGVIFSKNGTITSLENAQTSNILIYENIGNGNVSKGYVNGAKIGEQSLDNYSSYSANIGFVNGNPVYTRAYVIFTNKNTNEDMVVYGNYFVTNP